MPARKGTPGKKPKHFYRRRDPVVTPRQKRFVDEYVIDLNKKEAAIRAGISPSKAAWQGCQWTDPKKFPLVCLAIKRALALKESVAQYKADDVLRLLQTGAFLDPRPWFDPHSLKEESWRITKENYDKLPVEIIRLIKFAEPEIEFVVPDPPSITSDDPEDSDEYLESKMMAMPEPKAVPTGWLLVQLVDKEQMLAMLAKHMLGEKINTNGMSVQINWNDLRKPTVIQVINNDPVDDPIEAEILKVHNKNSAPALTDKPVDKDGTNGTQSV